MARLVPLFLAVAALLVAGIIVFGGGDEDPGYLPGEDPLGQDGAVDPELLTSEAAKRKKAADEAAAREAQKGAADARPSRSAQVLFLAGRVVDTQGGAGIAGALLSAEWSQPAPKTTLRIPRHLAEPLGIFEGPTTNAPIGSVAPRPGRTLTDKTGGFQWMVDPAGNADPSACDVFATATGYVPAMLRRPPAGKEALFQLQKAIPLDVTVGDRPGRPVAGAQVTVRPDTRTKTLLGHVGVATTDDDGRARVDGLARGPILLSVDHPAFMPVTLPAFDPATEPRKDVRLPPALRLSFKLRSDDASPIEGPILTWATDGAVPHEGLQLLTVKEARAGAAPKSEIDTLPVRISCEHRNVKLEVKANGFQAWTQVEPLPGDGGERQVLVTLTRDTALVNLEVAFVGPDDQPIPYHELGDTLPSIVSLDGKDIGSLRIQTGETLVFESLPAGRYHIGKISTAYAPAETDVEVKPGEPNRATLKLRPPAKLRIRFVAAERQMVRFRLLRGDVVLKAFPENSEGAVPGKALDDNPQLESGEEGTLYSGLSAGPCTIEVISPDLLPVRRDVQLQEGETTEVEIEVQPR